MNMEVDSDATKFQNKKPDEDVRMETQTYRVGGINVETNKAQPSSSSSNMSAEERFNQPRQTNTRITAGGINLDVNSTRKGNTKRVHSVFNIKGAKIQNASIGNTGPVEFNTREKKFEAGAIDRSVNIDGGHFMQANIGGQASYDNDGANINIGHPGKGDSSAKLSGEALVKIVLETNITAEDLIALIDKKYTIKQLSSALPVLCPPAQISDLAKALLTCA